MMTHDDARFWNGIAEKYAAQPVANVPAFERKKAITREHLRSDSSVLELGCGTGTLALEMARHAGHIQALDISAEMLRIANQKREIQGASNVTFRQGTLDGQHPTSPNPSTASGPTRSSISSPTGVASWQRSSTCSSQGARSSPPASAWAIRGCPTGPSLP
jgi:hypothetical protein